MKYTLALNLQQLMKVWFPTLFCAQHVIQCNSQILGIKFYIHSPFRLYCANTFCCYRFVLYGRD